jgi:hypothetical protein
MKYLCLVYYDEKKLDALSANEEDALLDEVVTYREVLRKSGHYIASDGLQPVRTAMTVRIHNGKASTTDGPFAETKEALGGLYLVEAADLDEALELARTMPLATFCSIEVRPLWHVNKRPGGKD